MADLALAGALVIIMASMGLALTVGDFRRVASMPRPFLVGTGAQVLALPLLAFAVAALVPMDPVFQVGLVVLAACPGGVTSNLLTHLAKGDTALSISLTAVISLFSFLTVPVVVTLALSTFMGADAPPLPILETQLRILLITVVPLGLGMLVNALAPRFAARIEPGARTVATVLFILVVLAVIWGDRDTILYQLQHAGPAVILLNVAAMAMGYSLAQALRLGRPQGVAISLECGLQNATLAIFICGTLLGDPLMAIPAGLYGVLMFGTAGLFIAFLSRSTRFAPASAPAMER